MGVVRESLGDDHEGYIAYLFADGTSGGTSQGMRVCATTDVLGRPLAHDDWQWHEAGDVVGWIPTCSCGWRDAPLIRVADRADAFEWRRTFVADEYGDPVDWMGRPFDVDELYLYPAWANHADFVQAQLVTTH